CSPAAAAGGGPGRVRRRHGARDLAPDLPPGAAAGPAAPRGWQSRRRGLGSPGPRRAGTRAQSAARPRDRHGTRGARGHRARGAGAALALVAVGRVPAAGASFIDRDRLPAGLEAAPGHILVEPLADAGDPAGRYDPDEGLALHPDLELLLDAANVDAAAADP